MYRTVREAVKITQDVLFGTDIGGVSDSDGDRSEYPIWFRVETH